MNRCSSTWLPCLCYFASFTAYFELLVHRTSGRLDCTFSFGYVYTYNTSVVYVPPCMHSSFLPLCLYDVTSRIEPTSKRTLSIVALTFNTTYENKGMKLKTLRSRFELLVTRVELIFVRLLGMIYSRYGTAEQM